MDKCTREVRKQYWKNIITKCMRRPESMTVKQWLSEYGICEQSYYHWLKRIRQENYELATNSNTIPVKTSQNEVDFVKILSQAAETVKSNDSTFQPDITIQVNSVVIGVSNTSSDILLDKVFKVIRHTLWSNRGYKDCYRLWTNRSP